MSQALFYGVEPDEEPPVVIGAQGPKMMALAAELTNGVHPYNVTPAHTKNARETLGAEPLICVEQAVLAETDPSTARKIAREMLNMYVGFPNYQRSWKDQGFSEDDWASGASDRLIDAMIAWGDLDQISARIQEHLSAGATHVCVQPLGTDPSKPDMALLEGIAGAFNLG